MTADGLPYIGPHRRYPHHWFALGYGGNGMTFGALAARLLLERWQGVKSRDHALFESSIDPHDLGSGANVINGDAVASVTARLQAREACLSLRV